jgi:hypothetical protein
MPLQYRNRQLIHEKDPELGQALDDAFNYLESVMQQGNFSPSGEVQPPPDVNALAVTAAQGVFDIQLTDNNSGVTRGVNYFVEYSESPSFAAPHVLDLGSSRNYRTFLGNKNLYFRAYSSYPTSRRSNPIYYGTANAPIVVNGGGAVAGPVLNPSSGAGTSRGGDGSDGGFGNFSFRGNQRPITFGPQNTE